MLISFSLSVYRRLFPSPRPRATDVDSGTRNATARLVNIVHQHLDAIYRTARRLGVRDADMEDAVQDVLVVVLRRLDDIQPGKERAFVVAVAAGIAANRRRRERRHPEDPSEALEEMGAAGELDALGRAPPNGEQSVERSRRLAMLKTGLDAMTEAQRAVFVLFELEELTAREIAQELGVSTFTVVSRVRRAREVLSRTLNTQGVHRLDTAALGEPEPGEP
jgi:RNA polymerase sigma-70 factor (ECF subfamily)